MKPAPAVSVSGLVTGPDGPASLVGMRLVPSDAELMATEIETSNTMSDSTGAFRFINVTPGQYTLKVVKAPVAERSPRDTTTTMVEVGGGMVFSTVTSSSPVDAPLPEGPTLWESIPISVGRSDLIDVSVSLRTGTRVSGRVEFEDRRSPRGYRPQRISIVLEPAGARWCAPAASCAGARANRAIHDRRNSRRAMPPSRHRRAASPLGLKSAMHDGRDLVTCRSMRAARISRA
jgi:hypothetical protein